MMGTQDGRISGQIVKVVHDDSDEEIEHKEGAEEDEGDEVGVGHVGPARLVGVGDLPGRRVPLHGPVRTRVAGLACQHDTWPGLTSGTSAY